MSAKAVIIKCKNCKITFEVPFKQRQRKFCSRECVNQFQTGTGNPAYGRTYRTKLSHPEWAQRVSKTHRLRKHIKGDKNPMKCQKTVQKMSHTRRTRFRNDPEFKERHAQTVRTAWAQGKYKNAAVGKCKWYSFTTTNGEKHKLQGTWELAYAKWLDSKDIKFRAHRGRLKYVQFGVERSYYPDFYIPSNDSYIEIKNRYHYSLNPDKINLVKQHNPTLKIDVLFYEDLVKLGITL